MDTLGAILTAINLERVRNYKEIDVIWAQCGCLPPALRVTDPHWSPNWPVQLFPEPSASALALSVDGLTRTGDLAVLVGFLQGWCVWFIRTAGALTRSGYLADFWSVQGWCGWLERTAVGMTRTRGNFNRFG